MRSRTNRATSARRVQHVTDSQFRSAGSRTAISAPCRDRAQTNRICGAPRGFAHESTRRGAATIRTRSAPAMVKNTRSENPNSDDAGSEAPAENPKRGLRRRVTAAKSAATHVNAGAEIVLDTVPDAAAPAPAKRAGGRKKKGEAEPEGAASTPPVEAAPPAARAAAAGRGSIAPLLFQAPDLPTPSPEAMARP